LIVLPVRVLPVLTEWFYLG